MALKFKFFLFATIFVISLGIVAIGILLTYGLNKTYKRHYLQTLLYQQIFIFSFLLYGAWGHIFILQALASHELNQSILNKASFIIPAIGMPFVIVSWYMLIKFFYELKNLKISKAATLTYFIFYVLVITAGAWYTNTSSFQAIKAPDNLIIKLMVLLNLAINLFLIIPSFFLKPRTDNSYNLNIPAKMLFLYLLGVFAYSLGIWFIKEHYLIAGATLLMLFIASTLIPVFVSIQIKKLPVEENHNKMDFNDFCDHYEISKREAEIILEICTGKSNKDIAETLFITLQTVKDHTHRIYTKTGVKNRVYLANLVREKIKKR